MNKEYVTLSRSELNRVLVLQRVVDGRMTIQEAAVVLGVGERHVKRLKARFKGLGPDALAHGNRGRKPAHAIPEALRQQVVELAQSTYKGCNYTFLSELLYEYEGISLSPSSIRRILKGVGMTSPRKHRPPKLHRRRQRKAQFGMLVQIDGSLHDWLEGRGPWLVLHGAIDDATGRILALTFRRTECFEGYRDLLHQLVTVHGIPVAMYTDRHSLFFPPERHEGPSLEQQLRGQVPLSQVGRMITELGINHIPAKSPQAKGRIERLWGTLQERLTVHLRLIGARTIEEAEAALPGFIERYNERFAVPPAEAEVAFKPVPAHIRLDHVLCWKEQRTVLPGYVIQYDKQTYRLHTPKGAPSIPLRTVVDVLELADGTIAVGWKGNSYSLEPLAGPVAAKSSPNQAPKPASRQKEASTTLQRRPAENHPWKKRAVIPRPNSTTRPVTNSLASFR